MLQPRPAALSLLFAAAFSFAAHALDAPDPAQMARGKELYQQNCFLCHQVTGQGTPGVFPPLAKSDYLMVDKARSIKIICEGISGEMTVNGVKYNGTMPPVALNDAQVADLLTYVRNSWGNQGNAVNAEEVRVVRSNTKFKTYEALVKASGFAPLPKAPEGFTLREVVQFPANPTRLAGDGQGKVVYMLANNGDVWRIDVAGRSFRLLLRGARYTDKELGNVSSTGMVLDSQRRLYIAVNQRNEKVTPVTDEVTIFRTTDVSDGDPFDPQPWLRTSYPWGIGPFNHNVNHMGFGPDGMLYVNSGSRTDGGEPGTNPRYATVGETPITACIWRLDPKAAKPEIEVFARGLRNAFGFCWDDQGRLVATDNGPDADMPEELNVIEKGKHYGFPFQFADSNEKPYPHTPDSPAGNWVTKPVANLGPDGGFNGKPRYTFHPHSSPAGIVYLGNDFPEGWRGTFLITRFGNLLKKPEDVGFDLLQARLKKTADGSGYEATMKAVLTPLARPIDIIHAGPGKLLIAVSKT
jgi:glucose/arabinose dehydrogenase/mono/diheme cytochrome c family protein